ncbi:hypothetical protein ES705_21985 [subsurface metagenome]
MRPPYNPKVWEDVNCPFCHSEKKKLYEKFGDRLQYTYVKCQQCKLIYYSPRPKYDKDFLEAAYEKYFVFDPNYEYAEKELWEFREEIHEMIGFDKDQSSMLDVGSCMGSFIKVAKDVYREVEGVEISENMASFTEQKLGVRIIRKQFESIEHKKKYSCIHMSHVIEHIPNPNEWMHKAGELLEKDGILVICIPNIHSLAREIKIFLKRIGLRTGRWEDSWRTPDHLFEPAIGSMKYLCKKNGFDIINYYTYSRKDPVSRKILSQLIHKRLRIGSNVRFYLRKA